MAAENTFHFPKLGQRIVRSVIAVACCFCVFYLRNREGIPFYSALAVLQCIQPYQDSMAQVAKKRVTGTFVGAFWGLVIILIQMYLFHGSLMDTFPGYMLISPLHQEVYERRHRSLIAITSRKPSRYTKTWYICIFWIKKKLWKNFTGN